MTNEKLGVLLVDVPEPSWEFNYLCYEDTLAFVLDNGYERKSNGINDI